jgi:hypothetical protein
MTEENMEKMEKEKDNGLDDTAQEGTGKEETFQESRDDGDGDEGDRDSCRGREPAEDDDAEGEKGGGDANRCSLLSRVTKGEKSGGRGVQGRRCLLFQT